MTKALKSSGPVERQITMAGGKVLSTKAPAVHLIPTIVLEKLAERFELGVEKKGDKAWNALSSNQEVTQDMGFILDRINHVIYHAMKLKDKIAKRDIAGIQEDNDASAIGWGAAFLICVVEDMKLS